MKIAGPTRNLALELVRVTEAAALAAGRFMGRGTSRLLIRLPWMPCDW